MNDHQGVLLGLLQVIHDEKLMANVQVVGWLVQNQGVRPLGNGTGNEHHLPLAAGQTLDIPLRQRGNPQFLHGSLNNLLSVFGILAGEQPHGNHFPHREIKSTLAVLPHIAQDGGQLPGGIGGDGFPVQGNCSVLLRNCAKGGFNQRGFSAAVCAHNTDNLAGTGGEGDGAENLLSAQLDGNGIIG